MTLSYDEAALEELGNLPPRQQQQVVNKIDRLCHPLARHIMLKEKTPLMGLPSIGRVSVSIASCTADPGAKTL